MPPRPRARDDHQLSLWSYAVLGPQVDEDGEAFHPEVPADYPTSRPHSFSVCRDVGLGDRWPCCFASCRHNLLADELRGDTLADDDIWARETCALSVAARGAHNTVELAKVMGHCESVVEEAQRRGIAALKSGLGLDEFDWPPRIHGFRPDQDGATKFAEQVAKLPERPHIVAPAVKVLSRKEVAALYGRKMVSRNFGQPRPPRAA